MPHPRASKAFAFESQDLEQVPIGARSYAKGFQEYALAARITRHWLGESKVTKPIVQHLDQIEYQIRDAKQQLQRSIDNSAFDDIDERMLIEGKSLESFLESAPHLDSPQSKDATIEPFLEDVEELYEHLLEVAKAPAFSLSSYLLSAKF